MTSPAMHASFAPLPKPVAHDPRLVRRYLWQTLLRFGGGMLLPTMIVAGGIIMLLLHIPQGGGRSGWLGAMPSLIALLAPVLGVNGMVRQQLRDFSEEGVVLTDELISARVTRSLSSPFDIFISFDLCAEALSGLATGQALGVDGPPAFAHDPFKRIITVGRRRPFRLFGATEVRLWTEPEKGVQIRVRRIVSGDFFVMQKGEALRAVEAVTAQLQASLARRVRALGAAVREEAAEKAALQAKLSALQVQVEPHFLFNTLANLKYLMRTEPAAALTMLDHLTDYLHSALIDYFQSEGKYTRVVSRGGEGLIRLSLKELLLQLNPAQFAQVHRSSIVNLHAVERIDKDGTAMAIRLKSGRGTLAVSEAYARQFRQM